MPTFPYHNNSAQLPKLLEEIQSIGVPSQVDKKLLSSIGFESGQSYSLRVLRAIGFVDEKDMPTGRWRAYRDQQRSRATLAQGIQEAYAGLFAVYPEAYDASEETLRSFFASQTDLADRTVACIVRTFRTLCELADFRGTVAAAPKAEHSTARPVEEVEEANRSATGAPLGKAHGLTLSINIQLVLPETKDESVYERLFRALRKHLLS